MDMAEINKEICALEDRIADLSSKSILHSTPHFGHAHARLSDSGIGSKRKSDATRKWAIATIWRTRG